jgi:Fe-S cluster assembly iron-binding protein IscA
MTVTDKAQKRLRKLLKRSGARANGFRIESYVGTCRGSSPVIKPVEKAAEMDLVIEIDDRLFVAVAEDCRQTLENAELDFQGGFLGRGLTLTWPHSDGCQCHCGK